MIALLGLVALVTFATLAIVKGAKALVYISIWIMNLRLTHGAIFIGLYLAWANQEALASWFAKQGEEISQMLTVDDPPAPETSEEIASRCHGLCVVPK